MLANVMLAGEVCQKLSGPADGNICSVFLILLIDRIDWPPESPDNQYHLNK